MKLRIEGSSLQLHLSSAELAQLERVGRVGDSIEFGPGADQRLVYTLEISNRSREPAARFRNGIITVSLPSTIAQDWLRGEQPTIASAQMIDGRKLSLLIEKESIIGDESLNALQHAS